VIKATKKWQYSTPIGNSLYRRRQLRQRQRLQWHSFPQNPGKNLTAKGLTSSKITITLTNWLFWPVGQKGSVVAETCHSGQKGKNLSRHLISGVDNGRNIGHGQEAGEGAIALNRQSISQIIHILFHSKFHSQLLEYFTCQKFHSQLLEYFTCQK
jgi:hypothetical protein